MGTTQQLRFWSLKRTATLHKKELEISMVNKFTVFAMMPCAAALSTPSSLQAQNPKVKNIVLVHGAWDGSGWTGVYNILVKDGFTVSIVQEPETSFQDDVTAVKTILALQDGPTILVAHSYGGSVITEAGTDPSVAGLVYVAAHMPEAGENEADDGKRFPSDLAKSGAIRKTADGFTYLDPAQFHDYFCCRSFCRTGCIHGAIAGTQRHGQFFSDSHHGCLKDQTELDARGGKRSNHQPGLRTLICQAGSHTVEVAGASHCVYMSHPKEVADVIESAARAVSK
jgi:pimeloyl-ACP methyl ester carboxylesterase